MVEGVAKGLAEQALRQNGAAAGEQVDGPPEPLVDGTALRGADGFAQGGSGALLTELFFDPVKLADLVEEPPAEFR